MVFALANICTCDMASVNGKLTSKLTRSSANISISLRAIVSKSSITKPNCCEALTMRVSATLYSSSGLSRPLSVISASPLMAVVGVLSSWLISANNCRRLKSNFSNFSTASSSSLVRACTSCSSCCLACASRKRWL